MGLVDSKLSVIRDAQIGLGKEGPEGVLALEQAKQRVLRFNYGHVVATLENTISRELTCLQKHVLNILFRLFGWIDLL